MIFKGVKNSLFFRMSEHHASVPACEETGVLKKVELAEDALRRYEAWIEGHEFAQRLFYGMTSRPTPTTSLPVACSNCALRGLGSRGPLKPGVGSNPDAF